MDLVEVWGSAIGPLGVLIQFIFLVLFVGAIPAALVGIALAVLTHRRRGHWSAAWSRVFQAGVLFQAGSLVSSLLMLWLLWSEVDSADLRNDIFGLYGVFVGAVFLNAAGSAFGLHSWRVLRAAGPEKRVR
jgi:hypothetical protein